MGTSVAYSPVSRGYRGSESGGRTEPGDVQATSGFLCQAKGGLPIKSGMTITFGKALTWDGNCQEVVCARDAALRAKTPA